MALPLTLMVNGQVRRLTGVDPDETLLRVLRERLGLLAAKTSCERGSCGACSVYVDGKLVCSCLVLAFQVSASRVMTAEALSSGDDLHPIQRALVDAGAIQCGFCIPGISLAIHNLLTLNPVPQLDDVRQALVGNLCRCSGYQSILRAAERAAAQFAAGKASARRAIIVDRAHNATAEASPSRTGLPDQETKVTGRFVYAPDLAVPGMAWGATVRSPYPRARIRRIDVGQALRIPGVLAVLTANDVKGRPVFGLESADQPVLCWDEVRYVGDSVAVVVATDARTARAAAANVAVEYEMLTAALDADLVMDADSGGVRATGEVTRHVTVRQGDLPAKAPVVVRGRYEVGMQDPAFLGPESGLAIPAADGGVDLHVATQSLHTDRAQVAESLGLPVWKVRATLSGVAGAFGGREDISLQIHVCMAALAVGRPVKMTYSSTESFLGHVHRHPARLWYEHGAAEDGRILYVKAQILLDGGAYTSTSPSVCRNAARFAVGPYAIPSVRIDSMVATTNNPPAGAMRGFGAVQTCFAYESQMDRLAAAVCLDPVEIRLRNVMQRSARLPTGERVGSHVSVGKLLRLVHQRAVAPLTAADDSAVGGASERRPERVRGIGYAVGMKNVSGGRESGNLTMATVTLVIADGQVRAEVSCGSADLGQGLSTIQHLIVRSELGVDSVVVRTPSTAFGEASPSSASRQTWVTGGAVKAACEAVRSRVLRAAAVRANASVRDLRLVGDRVIAANGETVASLPEILRSEGPITETRRYGRGPLLSREDDDSLAVAFVAHRAVVDVDWELGTVEVRQIDVAQDPGYAFDESGVVGQLEGGTVQGLGLAIAEELHIADGRITNPSFDRYLMPTVRDVGWIRTDIVEFAQHGAPYGVRGVGEAGTISSSAAVVAAIRATTGRPLDRMPVRPEDILGLPRPVLAGEPVRDR